MAGVLPLADLKRELEKANKHIINLEKKIELRDEKIVKLEAELEQYKSLTELKVATDTVAKLPEIQATSIVRVHDRTSNATGYVNVTYTMKGAQAVKMNIDPELSFSSIGAVNKLKVFLQQEVLSAVHESLIDVEWKDGQYKFLGVKE